MSESYYSDQLFRKDKESKEDASVERWEREREEKPYWISDCCGVHITNTDYDFCPDCLEHCQIIDLNVADKIN